MERVAQRQLVLGAAGAQNAGGGGGERLAPSPDAGPGRIFTDDLIELAERRAGQICRFGFAFRRFDRARPGRERRRRGGRRT